MAAATQVAFNNVPGDIRVPIFAAEINAGPPSFSGNSRQIVIGRAKTGSTAALAAAPINVGSMDPSVIAGAGTVGAEMLLFARRRNPLGEIWFLDAGDPASATAAAGAVTFTGTATSPGTITRYIAGERYDVNVATGDTAVTIAAAFMARVGRGYSKFNRLMAAPVTAAVDGTTASKVNLTANHTGTEGNWITILPGLDGDEVEVPGITVGITAMTGGAGDVDMAVTLAKLGSQPFDFITSPYSLTAQLNAARDFLGDTGSGRASPLVGLDGHYISATAGNLSTLTTFGQGRNDRHATLLGLNNMPHPRWSYVAALGGEIAFLKNLGRPLATAIEIVRPMQTRVLEGLRPALNPNDDFAPSDRDSLLRNGISTFVRTPDGQIACDRIITTYRVNGAGLPDTSFLDIEKVLAGVYVKRYMKNALLGTYPRAAMMEDNPQSIQGVVTPPQARACVVHAYEQLHSAGVVRQADLFAQNLVVQFDYANDRANFYLPVAIAAALRIFAANITLFADMSDQDASGL